MNTNDFLHELFSGCPDGYLEVTHLAPDGVKLYPRTVVQWAELPLPHIDFEDSSAHELNRKGYGCYFGLCVRRDKKAPEQRTSEKTGKQYTFYPRGKQHDALYLPALYVDIDDPSEDAMWRIYELCPPSIIVSTGGGWHGYWILTEPLVIDETNTHEIKRTLKGMAVACGGDTKVAELARVLRMPGTINTKPDRGGTVAHVVTDFGYPDARFHFKDFQRRFAHMGGARELRVDRPIPIEASQGLPKWVQVYLDNGASVGERNNRLYAVAREYKSNGVDMNQCLCEAGARARTDGLHDEEIERTIHSAYEAQGVVNIDPQFKSRIAAQDAIRRARRKNGGAA